MTVSVNIVLWNSRPFLPALLASLKQQTRQPNQVIIVDNASTDGSADFMQAMGWPVLRNHRNLGFTGGHNQALQLAHTDAALIANPDVVLDPSCLELLVATLEQYPQVGSVAPKVLRFIMSGGDLSEPQLTETIDAAGLIIKPSRQVLSRGEGEQDHGQYDQPGFIFGAPGMTALYRRRALESVADRQEYFDNDFFAYKEDADLAWRLRWAGWKALYLPRAVAYHHRTVPHHGDSVAQVFRTRSQRSLFVRRLSYRNHWLMVLKNDSGRAVFRHLHRILWYEMKKSVYIMIREPRTLQGVFAILTLIPRMRRKRRAMIERYGPPPAVGRL